MNAADRDELAGRDMVELSPSITAVGAIEVTS